MRLCIADPPYLGRGRRLYGEGASNRIFSADMRRKSKTVAGWTNGDVHPDADDWDDPQTHQNLVNALVADYDGWAIAMAWDNLRCYLPWVPADVWIGVWVKNSSPPSASRLHNIWEPVVVSPPPSRRKHSGPGTTMQSFLRAQPPQNFVGAKPGAWTRWVLDMLGYDAETDTVDDLFPGSGAVAAEIAQGVLNFGAVS